MQFVFVFMFCFGGVPGYYRDAPILCYLKRTVTCVSTDAFCTGMWIGIFVPLPFFCFIFSLRREALRFVHADCERRKWLHRAVFWS